MSALTDNLRIQMRLKKLNPRRLSLMAGLNAWAVRDILAEKSSAPLLTTLQKLAEALGCAVGDLTAPVVDPPPDIATKVAQLRRRAGLSMAAVGKALGMAGQSSYQRYEDPALFTKPFLPLDIAVPLANFYEGKGSPPITRQEVLALAGVDGVISAPKAPSRPAEEDWEESVTAMALRLGMSAVRRISILEADIEELRRRVFGQTPPAIVGDDSATSERLKQARVKAGYETASSAANAFGWPAPTYLSHENGSRGIPIETAKAYAKAFKVKAAWLLGLDDD